MLITEIVVYTVEEISFLENIKASSTKAAIVALPKKLAIEKHKLTMNQTKKCQICPRLAEKLIISHNFLLPLCLEHEKRLESKFGEIEPLTTTLTF